MPELARLTFVVFSLFALASVGAKDLYFNSKTPGSQFVAFEIQKALKESGETYNLNDLKDFKAEDVKGAIILALKEDEEVQSIKSSELKEQAFQIKRADENTVFVIGGDASGVMYGGLELAEQIRLGGSLKKIEEVKKSPYLENRGIKFNIPLDARTPSYDDTGDAAQNNIAEMWNIDFWKQYLDQLARDRYNVLTLWNEQPFPSLVKVPEFPDVALDDVCVAKNKPTWQRPNWQRSKYSSGELDVVKKMSIDEKITFWRDVLRHAKDRGISVYWITWNIKMHDVQGKYGITDDQDNPKTIDYMRASVRELILTYPDLAGIGITAGEHMKSRDDEFDREKWLWNSYGEGIHDAKKKQPNRKVHFIHRVWYSGLDLMHTDFLNKYNDTFDISFKYAQARLYCVPNPTWNESLLKEMKKYPKLKSWWNLRNDDIFVFRWGDPEYVRDFIKNFPKEQTAGYYMGSDGYVWGREFVSKKPTSPRELEIHKHWFRMLLWGRLGYDLELSQERIEGLLEDRFVLTDGSSLLEAWSAASKIVPLVNRFHYRAWDHMWSVEGCLSKGGFHDVIDFVQMDPVRNGGMISITDYVLKKSAEKEVNAITPYQVAEDLRKDSKLVLDYVGKARSEKGKKTREFSLTLDDMEAFAHLGNYYAAKIDGATDLGFYLKTEKSSYQEAAIKHLEKAVVEWSRYADLADKNYSSQLLARTRHLDWVALKKDVAADIEMAKNPAPVIKFKKENSKLKTHE